MFAARVVPGLAIDVPDQLLIDLERLAVTAWSARDRPRGRRGRAVASPTAVATVAARGTRLVTAASRRHGRGRRGRVRDAARDRHRPAPTRIGARCLVFFAGGALLLAARSYRHAAARAMLRCGRARLLGLARAAILRDRGRYAGHRPGAGGHRRWPLVLVVVAVATGRGWRSAWWARRAEVAEGLCGAAALASVFVAVGPVPAGLGADLHRREVVLGPSVDQTACPTRVTPSMDIPLGACRALLCESGLAAVRGWVDGSLSGRVNHIAFQGRHRSELNINEISSGDVRRGGNKKEQATCQQQRWVRVKAL